MVFLLAFYHPSYHLFYRLIFSHLFLGRHRYQSIVEEGYYHRNQLVIHVDSLLERPPSTIVDSNPRACFQYGPLSDLRAYQD